MGRENTAFTIQIGTNLKDISEGRPDGLDDVPDMNELVSPQLQIKFDTYGPELLIYRPNGERFLTFTEIAQPGRG
jgi:hypothetical protein